MSNIEQLSTDLQSPFLEQPSFQVPPGQVHELDEPDVVSALESDNDVQAPKPRGGRIARRVLAAAITLELVAGIYTQDVLDVNAQLEKTDASLVHVYDTSSAEHTDTMVVDMAGLGSRNSFATARAIQTYDRMGDVEAVIYDNKGIDSNTIATLIIQKALAENKKYIILDGHSMGGLVAAEVGAIIHAGDSGLIIKALLLDCTPADYDSVREPERAKAETIIHYSSFVPGIKKSRYARFIAEMIARKDTYMSLNDWEFSPTAMYRSAVQVVQDKFLSPDAPSGVLLESQYGNINDANMTNSLKILSVASNGKPASLVIFEQPRNVLKDGVVDDDRARQILEVTTTKYGLRFYTYYTKGGHANPIQAPETYNDIGASIATVVNQVPKSNRNTLTLAYPVLRPTPTP
jgi:pimeloyl-ACP methyl ester carboxylesterase